tara:strand:+ start:1790 stop:2989 length:1200 start_codon:yes stop_codon:yes gene_type:complete
MEDFIGHHIEGEHRHEININQSGAFNKSLINNLVDISVSNDWEEAKHEWRATGNVWYRPMRYLDTTIQELPEPHCDNHPNYCVCGHPIAWHFEVENTENGTLEILGSEHITNWMIIRHLKENKGIPEDAITEEKIIEWMKEAVKTMKAEWWWKEHGDDWEEMFNEVKELDLRINVRSNGQYWDSSTKRHEDKMVIAKTKTNSLGKMASVVWRWNHPDNPRRQIDTRGYPNEKLWRDVQLLFAKAQRFEKQLDIQMEEVEQRKSYIREQQAKQDELAEQRRMMIKEEAMKIRAEAIYERDDKTLAEACEYYDLPPFTVEKGNNEWERNFLKDMKGKIIARKQLSPRQLNRILQIIMPEVAEEEPATSKQINYIKKLGGEVLENMTKTQASDLIGELLRRN